MVVEFDDNEITTNPNAIVYGEHSDALREAYLKVLNITDPAAVTENQRQKVNEIMDTMNRLEVYVDGDAGEKKVDWWKPR
ncbi:MAG: hypothetical protein ACRC31_06440 [Cetobacterium sp.]